MTRDEEKKNVAKHAKNAWLAIDNVIATSNPSVAPLRLTPFRFKPYDINSTGTNTENSHRVGGIVELPATIQIIAGTKNYEKLTVYYFITIQKLNITIMMAGMRC